jgi:hypothetical protein
MAKRKRQKNRKHNGQKKKTEEQKTQCIDNRHYLLVLTHLQKMAMTHKERYIHVKYI